MIVLAGTAAGGPTWLAVLGAVGVGSVLSSLVTGGFLRAQARRQEAREDARMTRESAQREVDRMNALRDHWRDARHAAHVETLQLMDAALRELGRSFALFEIGDLPAQDVAISIELREDLQRSVADARLIGDDATSDAATEAMKSLYRLETAMILYTSPTHPQSRAERANAFLKDEVDAQARLTQYRQAVRLELGVTSGDGEDLENQDN